MNMEVFPIRIGVLIDSFDPVRPGHLTACRTALKSRNADRVLLILTDRQVPCSTTMDDRERMLSAACSCSKSLVPCRLPPLHQAEDTESILHYLQKKYPGDDLFLLDSVQTEAGLCPSVQEYIDVAGLYGTVSRLECAVPWLDRLYSTLSPHRFAHSLSVARTAVQLAARFRLDAVRAEEAGLLHDCAKYLSLPEMQRIARKHNLSDDPVFLGSSALLHSVTGTWIAQKKYGMKDPAVLEAIAYHNTGCAGMSPLSMCVCLADYIEPNRDPFPGLEEVRRLSETSLEKALLLSLENVAAYVRSVNKTLHPRTLSAIEWLKSLPSVQSPPVSSGIFAAD